MVPLHYLEDGKLPDNDTYARRLASEKSRHEIIVGTLHFENPSAPGRWSITVPKELRAVLMRETRDGKFAGHFSEQKSVQPLEEHILVG